ncbi:MAG: CRTAC1 family protein [Planctomycetaceae bacterium]|nr:CRTAC1 family protein [Planctomycetaceae bacterium]
MRLAWSKSWFCLAITGMGAVLLMAGCPQTEPEKESGEEPDLGALLKSSLLQSQESVQNQLGHRDLKLAFRELGAENGFEFTRFDDISARRRILETNGGGVAVFDYDRDGWLDLYLTNGSPIGEFSVENNHPSKIFRNRFGTHYRELTTEANLMQPGFDTGCAVGDYNSDGFPDLYVAAIGENHLWVNNGDGTFEEQALQTADQVERWTTSVAFADLNSDGILDIYAVNYLDESLETPTVCPNSQSPDGFEGCSPALFQGVPDDLFWGDGEGGFHHATNDAGIGRHPGKGLGVVIADLDQNRSPEIYVANDGEPNFLFVRNQSDSGTTDSNSSKKSELSYEEVGLLCGLALNERGYSQASMGIACGDYDGNGTQDLYLTHFFGDTNTLYANLGELKFVERTRGSGLGASSRNYLGFGTTFFDADNDGWLDLFVANGHVDDRTWMPVPEDYRMYPQLFLNERDGHFKEIGQSLEGYFSEQWIGRGVATGDLNRDGFADLVVSHQLDPSIILMNETDSRHQSITLRLIGTESHRDAFGAIVVFQTTPQIQTRELVGGGSFQSASALEVHAGLGTESMIPIEIRWPSGNKQQFENVSAGDWVVVENQGIYSLIARPGE